MLVRIGTNNPLKVEALREVLLEMGVSHVLESANVPSDVREQPISYTEITAGARNRCSGVATTSTDLAVGIESGVVCISGDWFDVTCVQAAYKNQLPDIGYSCAFPLPWDVGSYIEMQNIYLRRDITLNQIYEEVQLTSDPKLGNHQGAISIETGGHYNRKDQIKQALICALGKRFPK